MVRTVRETISGIRVIKALSKTDYEREHFAQVNGELVRREKKAGITMALTNPMMNLFLNGGLTLVIVVGAFRVNAGVSSAGNIIAFLSYFTIILNAMMAVTRIFVMCSKGIASGSRIQEVLETPEDLHVTPQQPEESPYHIVFDHVTFSYNHTEPNVEDISFRSTRIRALDNSVITVENSKVSAEYICNTTTRSNRLFSCTVGLTYDTPRETLERLCTDLVAMMNADDQVIDGSAEATLSAFNASSIDLDVRCYTTALGGAAFRALKDKLNRKIMDLVAQDGCDFAFPSTTVYLEKNDP